VSQKRRDCEQALNSPHWWRLKDKARARADGCCEHNIETGHYYKLDPITKRCERPGTQLHHRHYRTLGHETLEDVLLVCDHCHMILTMMQHPCELCCAPVWHHEFDAQTDLDSALESQIPPPCLDEILADHPFCAHCEDVRTRDD
jgi:hypothetical protein